MNEQRSIICEAIQKRLLLEFRYGGLPRVVEPYAHGNSPRGTEVLRAVQVDRSSSSGGFVYGNLWALDLFSAYPTTTETFPADDPNYNPEDSDMQSIHCRIE